MSLLDRVKERTGSDLSDSELQAMIDGITAELNARLGPAGQQTFTLGDLTDPVSRDRRTLKVMRPIDTGLSVTVVEVFPGETGKAVDQIQLADDDYHILHGGRTLQRLIDGTNGRFFWAPLVRVTYTPIGDQAARDEATIKLVGLDLSYRGGLKSERAGDYSFTVSGDPTADREAILSNLEPRSGMVMA
jgi:hypothetical protein